MNIRQLDDFQGEIYSGDITQKLPSLASKEADIKVCRDFYCGFDRIMTKEYVPPFRGEREENYKLRIGNTQFSNYFERIVNGFSGLIFQKEPQAENLEDFHMDDVDGRRSTLSEFMNKVFTSSLVAGVEFVSVESDQKLNRAFFKRYKYEQLYYFKVSPTSGKLIEIVFKESVVISQGRKEFRIPQYIRFLDGGGEVYREDKNGKAEKVASWENDLEEIPVVAIATGKEEDRFVYTPQLYDIAKHNLFLIQHETLAANLILKMTIPIMAIFGKETKNKLDNTAELHFDTAITFTDKTREGIEYSTCSGEGVKLIEQRIERTQAVIDSLVYNLFTSSQSKTVIEAHEQQNKSSSFLRMSINQLQNKFNLLLKQKAAMERRDLPEGAKITLKNGFDDAMLAQHMLKTLAELHSSGAVSNSLMNKILMQASIITPEMMKDEPKVPDSIKKPEKKEKIKKNKKNLTK